MKNNYDKIARYYDRLSRLVFFKSQLNAQVHQLRYLPAKGRVLIVGGGTGWILEEISRLVPEGLHLVYVEISAKMMALSKERSVAGNTIDYINLGIEDFSTEQSFDVICTPFLFDNFGEESAIKVFHQLNAMLSEEGLWFHTDFILPEGMGTGEKEGGRKEKDQNESIAAQRGHWWKTAFLTMMYQFFKIVGNVEASKLINMSPYFRTAGYQLLEEKFYYKGFIQSLVLQKPTRQKPALQKAALQELVGP